MAALLLTRRSTAACRLLRPTISSSSSTSSSSPIPPPITNTALPPQHHDKPLFFSFPNPITTTTTQYHHLPTPTKLRFFPTSFKPSPTIAPFLSSPRFLSSSSPQDGEGTQKAAPAMKHQEIEGPTVERDLSALAQETRQVLENLQRVLYDLSKYMAILALAHLASGAWIAYHAAAAPPSPAGPLTDASSIQGFAAFAFPFAAAFLLRRSVLPMRFFQKMEEQGRLQILTLSLQVSKCLNLLLLRLRLVSASCVVGLALGMMYAVWAKTRTATTTTTT